MNVAAVTNHTPTSAAAALEYAAPTGPRTGLGPRAEGKSATPSPADVKKAAQQFEAIIMRQLLAPSIEPIMSGGLGGAGGTGGGVYAHMLTEVLADSLSKGGGLGLGQMLEKQFSARAGKTASDTADSGDAAAKATPALASTTPATAPSAIAAPLSSKSLFKSSTSSTPSL